MHLDLLVSGERLKDVEDAAVRDTDTDAVRGAHVGAEPRGRVVRVSFEEGTREQRRGR